MPSCLAAHGGFVHREPPPDPGLGAASKPAAEAAEAAQATALEPGGPADDAGVLSGQSVATVHREHDTEMDAARTKEVGAATEKLWQCSQHAWCMHG